jgi:putative GTP pyrophosphokinase
MILAVCTRDPRDALACQECQMAYPVPKHSRSEVNKAGGFLADLNASADDLSWAHEVLGNWRACHGYPINTFQATLRTRIEKLEIKEAIVAQRLKRTPSIIQKLRRFPGMQLARMQDIGGLRAVVTTLKDVRRVQSAYKKKGGFQHELISEKDYISQPKTDGYRSVHLVFRYKNDHAPQYSGLSLELQIRTKLQHAWATAVETMGTFLGQALKARQGEEEWLKFFEVTGSAFAYLEKCPLVPGYDKYSREETYQRVKIAEQELGVLDKLAGFSAAVNAISEQDRYTYHLVVLNSMNRSVNIQPYARTKLAQAMRDYTAVEARADNGEPIEVVLVSAGPVHLLRKAYPNYFLDTADFMARVQTIIRIASDKRRGRKKLDRQKSLFD